MPFRVKEKVQRVMALDLEAMFADISIRGDFEKLLYSVIVELRQAAEPILLFIDKFHMLIGAGAAEGAVDAHNILAPALARGEARVLATSTLDDYRKYVERDQALQRRFQEVIVRELSE
jgi:ATP-dependent Clp protease ATP-binding subunit ClpA